MRTRAGVALFAALALLTVLGLLITGAIASLVVAQRAVHLARTDAVLTGAADEALSTVLGNPLGYGLADLLPGHSRVFPIALGAVDSVDAVVAATALPAGVVWLVASVTQVGPDSARRRTNLVARFPAVGPTPAAGITARGGVVANDRVVFSADTTGDAGCVSLPDADVVVAPGAATTLTPGARVRNATSAADTSTYFLSSRQLARLDSSAVVVHVHGDTTIAGGTFEGILVADGAIIVTGSFVMTGLMIARDSIVAPNGGLAVTGALMSFAPRATGVHLVDSRVTYSICSLIRELQRATRPRAVRGRRWAELF